MKRALFLSALIFACAVLLSQPVYDAYALTMPNEQIEFFYGNRCFFYNLDENVKKSSQFDLNYEINKYNRFSSPKERKALLKQMLEIGIEPGVAVEYLFPSIGRVIGNIKKNIEIAPADAKLTTNYNGEEVFKIFPEQIGVEMDKCTIYNNIISAYLQSKPLKIEVATKKLLPKTFKTDYEKFTNLRSDFSTSIASSSADRKHNIKNALNTLNGIEIAPNQTFSFNKTVGRRTQENGYREAKIIVNNEFIDGVGGGVCQVSTTLYNAALLAGLDIVEANKHSKQINYVKYGFDAMVNFGSSDLKFKNNTNQKLTIITNYSPKTARIRIFGEKPDYTYKLTNEIVSSTEPETEILFDENGEYKEKVSYEDEFFYLKKPSKGMEIKSYREKYKNGQLVAKELLRYDKFKVQNAVKIYGTKKREDNEMQPSSLQFDYGFSLIG